MDNDTLAYALKEVKEDVKEVKKDVKSLMLFMAVEKAKQKRSTVLVSGMISLFVALVVLGIEHFLR